MQKWYVPNISEEDVLEKEMSEIMVNLLQMKMEGEAQKQRRKYEEHQAKIKAKTESNK